MAKRIEPLKEGKTKGNIKPYNGGIKASPPPAPRPFVSPKDEIVVSRSLAKKIMDRYNQHKTKGVHG